MNMNRQSRRDDVLFVIALLVPAIFAVARYNESSRETAALVAQQAAVHVVQAHTPSDARHG